MKVYYFLFGLEQEDFTFFLERTWMISRASDIPKVIEAYFFRIGDPSEGRSKNTSFLEAMLFLEVFLTQGLGAIDDIEWVHDKNFLVCNESLYQLTGSAYQRVDENVVFVTSRDSWKHPFFTYIHRFLGDQVRLLRPNHESHSYQADKLNSISKLWSMRDACVGDIIIPLLRNKHAQQIRLLLEFAKARIGDQIVVKNNFGVEGKKVRALDLRCPSHGWGGVSESLKTGFFDAGVRGVNGPYLVRHYRIVKEFRIYYTLSPSGQITIYSVKNRENTPKDGGAIFAQSDFTRESLDVVWHYQHPDDFCRDESDAFDLCKQIVPILGAEIGVLELCREDDGRIRFLELNHLGGALMHRGSDESLLRDYYRDMWAGQLAKLARV